MEETKGFYRLTNRCFVCSKELSALKVCGKCGIKVYCSRDCQKIDWKTHKLECGTAFNASKDPSKDETTNREIVINMTQQLNKFSVFTRAMIANQLDFTKKIIHITYHGEHVPTGNELLRDMEKAINYLDFETGTEFACLGDDDGPVELPSLPETMSIRCISEDQARKEGFMRKHIPMLGYTFALSSWVGKRDFDITRLITLVKKR